MTSRARELRHEPTPAERVLWGKLRYGQLGFRFRRQHPVEGFVLDFYCAEARLGIELDGESHLDTANRDQWRSKLLEQSGLKILRFWNTEIFDDLDAALESIWSECDKRVNRTSPR